MYKEIFTERLKKARKNTGFTQRQAAEETGIKHSTIASYEVGRTEPNIENLGILAEFYGVSIDWLLGIGARNNFNLDGVERNINYCK